MSIPDKPTPSLLDIRVPHYKYYPTDQMKRHGPEQWERFRIVQACERLGIPRQLWPNRAFPQPPRQSPRTRMWIPNRPEKFDLPPFEPLIETIAEWRKRSHDAFDKTLDEYAGKFQMLFQRDLAEGKYKRIPSTRDTTPLNLRYEWAAQRICYNTPYKKLADAEKGYSEDRIKQSVRRILEKAGLNEET
jgi:hypothetical protein